MEIIHRSGYLSNVPLQKKLATLEDLYNRSDNPYSVHDLCDALWVARGIFYNHIFRRADRSKYEEEQQAQLMLEVKQIFDDNEQCFGADKICIVLADSGIHVNKKRILAIMQELGISGVRVDTKKQFQRKQQYEKQNLLKREFSAGHLKPDMGQRYHIVQSQKLLGLSLHYLGFVLMQNRWVAGIPKHEHKPGHLHLSQ